MNHRNKNQIHLESKSRSKSGEQGFTLIETAISLVVMMVIALAVALLFVFAVRYNAGANDRAVAIAIAQQRMERLRKTPFSDASLSTPSSTQTYVTSGHSYTVVTSVCSTSDCGGSSTSRVITIQVTPTAANSQWAQRPATIITKRSAPTVGAYLP